jgi:hypothetical protein
MSQTDSSGLFVVANKRKADTICIRVIAMFLSAFYKRDFYKRFIGQSKVKILLKI